MKNLIERLEIRTMLSAAAAGADLSIVSNDSNLAITQPVVNVADQARVAYYTEWSTYSRAYQVSDIPGNEVTHVFYAFAKVMDDGTIGLFDSYAAIDKSFPGDTWDQPLRGNFNQLQKFKAQYPNVKVIISIGGWTLSGKFSDVALNQANRDKFSNSVVDFMRKYKFDGADIDWEYPGGLGLPTNTSRPEDKQNFTLLLQNMRQHFDTAGTTDGKRYELCAAVPSGFDKIANINPADIAPYLDLVNILTYDYHGGWEDITNHQQPLYADPSVPNSMDGKYSVSSSVQQWLDAGVPANKLTMGLVMYQRAWKGVPNTNNGLYQSTTGLAQGTYPDEPGVFNYADIYGKVQAAPNDYKVFWDDASKASYVYSATQQGGMFSTYETQQSFRAKMLYLKDKGLGGVFAWELSSDIRDNTNHDQVLYQMNRAMLDYTAPTVTNKSYDNATHTLSFTFSEDVDGTPMSIVIKNTATQQMIAPLNFAYDAVAHKLSYTLPSLADGPYSATVSGDNTWDLAANRLDGDNNGTAGGENAFVFQVGAGGGNGGISGNVWNDSNSNGTKDGAEGNLSNWVLYLDSNNNNVNDAGEVSATTDASGNYSFSALGNGTYNVKQVVKSGYRKTLPAQGTAGYSVVVSGADVGGRNFGDTTNIFLGGKVFNDSNSNGVQDGGEAGIPSVTVQIISPAGGSVIATRTTAADGSWKVQGLASGSGQAKAIIPGGFSATSPAGGIYSGSASSGERLGNLNFGLHNSIGAAPALVAGGTILSAADSDLLDGVL